jgi:hypothetical protein
MKEKGKAIGETYSNQSTEEKVSVYRGGSKNHCTHPPIL